ncbi:MAG: hypothetical protein ACQERB_07275 [Promethearchaeati archaeon]
MPKKNKDDYVTYNNFDKLKVKIDDLKQQMELNDAEYKKTVDSIHKRIGALDEKLERTNEQIETQIKTQDEIIMDMIKKFNEEFLKNKNSLITQIDEIKSQQDILKISYSINEKKLLEKVQDLLREEMKMCVRDNEKEILMDIWIRELKQIINDVEKLRKLEPKEFALQLNEISNTISLFKQKLE